MDTVRRHFKTPAEIAVNHLYNRSYVAHVAAFREHLIERAQGREPLGPGPVDDDEPDAWRGVLVQRTREAHERSLITDGMARRLLGLEAGAPLPW